MDVNFRDALLGDRHPRIRILVLAVTLPLLASIAFLLKYDLVLGFTLLYVSLVIALYAGWTHAGMLAGVGAVFLTVLWRFIFPPFVGYFRWSMDTRYTPPRILGYKLSPRGELVEGLTHGPFYAFLGAVILGGLAYFTGTLLSRIRQQRTTTN